MGVMEQHIWGGAKWTRDSGKKYPVPLPPPLPTKWNGFGTLAKCPIPFPPDGMAQNGGDSELIGHVLFFAGCTNLVVKCALSGCTAYLLEQRMRVKLCDERLQATKLPCFSSHQTFTKYMFTDVFVWFLSLSLSLSLCLFDKLHSCHLFPGHRARVVWRVANSIISYEFKNHNLLALMSVNIFLESGKKCSGWD